MPKMQDVHCECYWFAVIEHQIRKHWKLAYPAAHIVMRVPLRHRCQVQRTGDESIAHAFGCQGIVLRDKFNDLSQIGQRAIGD